MPAVNAAELALITAGPPDRSAPRPRLSWKHFVWSRNVWALCLMYGFVGFACGIVSCVLSGVLSDWLIRRTGNRKWGRRVVGITTLALAGLACLLAMQAEEEVWLLAVAFGAWMLFSDGTMGPGWAACADVGEKYAGTLSGAMNMIGAFIGAAGLAFAGLLLDQGNYDLMFLAFACSYGLAALCWLGVDVTKPLVPRADQEG
jgi:MFS family permease